MKAAIFLAEGFEEIEAVATIDVLRRGGLDLTIASVKESKEVTGSHGITIIAEQLFNEMYFDAFDMLILPGGMPGTKNLRAHIELCELLLRFYQENKVLCAICAAPSILGELGILDGKKATCYPGFEGALKGCEVLDQPVVASGRIITGKGAGVAIQFGLEILRLIKDAEYVDSLQKSLIVY